MTLPRETIATGAPRTCPDCGVTPAVAVYQTCGYYIGTYCDCGPYTRESGYYKTRRQAEHALRAGTYTR